MVLSRHANESARDSHAVASDAERSVNYSNGSAHDAHAPRSDPVNSLSDSHESRGDADDASADVIVSAGNADESAADSIASLNDAHASTQLSCESARASYVLLDDSALLELPTKSKTIDALSGHAQAIKLRQLNETKIDGERHRQRLMQKASPRSGISGGINATDSR
jgi:hypothetical protein